MRLIQYAIIILFLSACAEKKESMLEIPKPFFLVDKTHNYTPTYEKVMAYWDTLSYLSPQVDIREFGMSDKGIPLSYVWITADGTSPYPDGARSRPILLINNAIHPGEPDGVDASMLLAYNLLTDSTQDLLKYCDIAVIPIFNIGGALNRNRHTRANQNGPIEYGFRGNAQNLDLNRDFAKCDSRNARSFAQLIDLIDPDFYVETHVSNGADYQYMITYLSTQEEKIGEPFSSYLRHSWTPFLNERMTSKGFDMSPYVNVHGITPDNGFETFYDSPRYSTGYLATKGIPGYITETHMLKPYLYRVTATFQFLWSVVELMRDQGKNILDAKAESRNNLAKAKEQVLDWKVDHTKADTLKFKGFEAITRPSEVTGADRLFYDRSQPFERPIPYYSYLKKTKSIDYPKAYILKRGFVDVEERLAEHGIQMLPFDKDTTMELQVYHIDSFETSKTPYEKHYFHHNTRVKVSLEDVSLDKGDFLIPLDDKNKRLICELLEPEAPDSYFNWNYFDAILQQKEWYSAYVFEDKAAQMLKTNNKLNEEFEQMKKDPKFRSNPQRQLYWVYKHSEHYEKAHLRYPVYRQLN